MSLDQRSEHRLLVIGATGMLGHVVMRFFADTPGFRVVGTSRSNRLPAAFPQSLADEVHMGIDAANEAHLQALFATVRPHSVINCAGLIKHREEGRDAVQAILANALLPHRLARSCEAWDARLVHISTDCVFSGSDGHYSEASIADSTDLYGRSKLAGEVTYGRSLTLRTSIIGPELQRELGLLAWVLRQSGQIKGYARAIFSGLPTVELARVIRDYVLPQPDLQGLYHVSSAPISKFDLLHLIRNSYGLDITIEKDLTVQIDRSLDSTRFRHATQYEPPPWPQLIEAMKSFG